MSVVGDSFSGIGSATDVEVLVGPVAHGGHCVARHPDGRVIFVRHALPGETVRVRLTSEGNGGKFLRGDAVEIVIPSADRRERPCPYSGPSKCGGCDWQHVTMTGQLQLKTAVLREALTRTGGLSVDEVDELNPVVEPIDGADNSELGLGWRTRVRYAVSDGGTVGMRRARSHDVIEVEACPLGVASIRHSGVGERDFTGYQDVDVIADGDDVVLALDGDVEGSRSKIARSVAGREWRVSATGFWQVHAGAAAAMVSAVGVRASVRPGDHIIDLYGGVGLFAGSFIDAVGPGGRLEIVESDERACADARRNLHDVPIARIHNADVAKWLRSQAPKRADLVILDPPRAGAGAEVMQRVVRLAPRRIVYIACDPVSLARDIATARSLGWGLSSISGFDLFPNTQHFEVIAVLEPS